MKIERDWKEAWVDEMGLIVALSGEDRFFRLNKLKFRMGRELSEQEVHQLRACLRQRFTPTNGQHGCQEATSAVKEITA